MLRMSGLSAGQLPGPNGTSRPDSYRELSGPRPAAARPNVPFGTGGRQVTFPNYIAVPLCGIACALNDNDNVIEVNAVTKMEVGPPQVFYRRDLQTALRCFPGDWEVLNG
jgi:hypothetical protein